MMNLMQKLVTLRIPKIKILVYQKNLLRLHLVEVCISEALLTHRCKSFGLVYHAFAE